MILHFFLLGFAIGVHVMARADVIFVDFNNNAGEVATAKEVARKRGEQLIVLGHISAEEQLKVAKLQWDMRIARALRNLPQEERIRAMTSLTSKLASFEYNQNRFRDDLARLQNSGKKISSLVISGHNGNGAFFGENGELSSREIREAFAANKELGAGIRSVFLAGCYTGGAGALDTYWKGMLPNATLIGGYDGSAPLGNSKPGWKYLGDFLENDKELAEAHDREALNKIFKRLRGVNATHAALCSGDLFVNNKGVATLSELRSVCEKVKKEVEQWNDRFQCYLEGAPGCENPPLDTVKGELRQIYTKIQSALACVRQYESSDTPFPPPPDPERMLRLMLFKAVANSAMTSHPEFFERYDTLMAQSTLKNKEPLGDITKLNRANLISMIKNRSKELDEALSDPKVVTSQQGQALVEAQVVNSALNQTLRQLEPKCIPRDWVEQKSRPSSSCLSQVISPSESEQREHLLSAYGEAILNESFKRADHLTNPEAARSARINYLEAEKERVLASLPNTEASEFAEVVDDKIRFLERRSVVH